MELTEAEVEKLLVRIAKVFLFNQLVGVIMTPHALRREQEAVIASEARGLADELWPVEA